MFVAVKFPTVFKLFHCRIDASYNFATVTFFTVLEMCRHRVNAAFVLKTHIKCKIINIGKFWRFSKIEKFYLTDPALIRQIFMRQIISLITKASLKFS